MELKFNQRDIDNARHEGYKIAEAQYSENIRRLKEEIKCLKRQQNLKIEDEKLE